jgi:hypothetical protein
MFKAVRLKPSYVGVVHIFDLKSKKVLLTGGGHFDVENRKLDVLFDCEDIYKDVEWVPILQTEEGYFCPAQSSKGHLIGGAFTFDHRSKFSMSSFFHWKSSKGLDHITQEFDSMTIEVAGLSGQWPVTTFSKDWHDAEMVSKGVNKDIEEHSAGDLTTTVKATYSSSSTSIQQKIRFKIAAKTNKIALENWIPLANAFRLYWLFQHDRTDCHVTISALGDSLFLVTDLLELKGFDDGTDIVGKALQVEAPMNAELLTKTADFFLNGAKAKGRGGIEFAFYRLLGYRFRNGSKRVGDDLLDLVFALDGFCADINKSNQRKLSKTEKESARKSIGQVLEAIEELKDELDPRVYDFYIKPVDKIFDGITHKPYRESVQQCFESLGMDYAAFEDIILEVDKTRQIFVHGKHYDTEDLTKKIYTHGTTTINESVDNNEIQIVFGQTTGQSEKYYKMVRQLFMSYFVKPTKTA